MLVMGGGARLGVMGPAMVQPHEHNTSERDSFPTTQWSLVARAGAGADPGDSARREALGVLLGRYRPALRAHLLSRRIRPDRADDLVQGFIADKVLEKDLLARADKARGRFRHFLQTSLNNYAANQLRSETAERRAPRGAKVLSLDKALDPPAGGNGHARTFDTFDVAWARELIAEAVRRMREGCIESDREDLWAVFESRVLAPAIGTAEPFPYEELVRRFGYASPEEVYTARVTALRRFDRALRAVLSEYVSDEDELEAELKALGEVLSSAAARDVSAQQSEESSAVRAESGGAPGMGG